MRKFIMKKMPIYMDCHATTPVDSRVLRAMLPYFTQKYGNASSATHFYGLEARAAVERARAEVARFVHADPREVVFTSGATESNNLALKGVAESYRGQGDHIISVLTEHSSVLDPLKRLKLSGFRVTLLPVRRDGIIDLENLERAITGKTILVSVMLANNEIGVIQPVARIAMIARKRGLIFHCDAAQAAGKIPINFKRMGIDLLSFSAHKMYGPKGIGALVVRKSEVPVRLVPQIDGGAQEVGLRSGTINVAGVVGFGEACRILRSGMKAEQRRILRMRNELWRGLRDNLDNCFINGSTRHRLSNNLNVSFAGIQAKEFLDKIKRRVSLSSGSACLSTSPERSYVLKALGVPKELAEGSIRYGLGRFNSSREVRSAINQTVTIVQRLRQNTFSRGGRYDKIRIRRER
jgi:cysteine desulfurase